MDGLHDHALPSPTPNDGPRSAVGNAVQQWEQRGSVTTSRRSSDDRARGGRQSYPPPAPSSGLGVGATSSSMYAMPVANQSSFSSASSGFARHEYPVHAAYSEKDIRAPAIEVQDDEDDERETMYSKSLNDRHALLNDDETLYTYAKQQARSPAATNNVYVAGPSAMNPTKAINTKSAGIWRTPFWPKGSLLASSKALYRQLLWFLVGAVVLFIPGIVAIVFYHALRYPMYAHPTCFGVGLFWWSVWLASAWAGLWICSFVAYLTPTILRVGASIFVVPLKQQITYIDVTRRYFGTLLWSLFVWITYLSIVWLHFPGHEGVDDSLLDPLSASNSTVDAATGSPNSSSGSLLGIFSGQTGTTGDAGLTQAQAALLHSTSNTAWLITFSRFFFGLVICCALLLGEKLSIQSVANNFHQITYTDRIEMAKYHTSVLVDMYSRCNKKLGFGLDTSLHAEQVEEPVERARRAPQRHADHRSSQTPSAALRPNRINWHSLRNVLSLKGVHIRTMVHASDPLDSSFILNPLGPESIVEASLEDRQETLKLASRIFDSFATSTNGDSPSVRLVTFETFLSVYKGNRQVAKRAFAVLDRDNNGSCSWEELLSACLEIHRERVCLLASMHDVDSAVAKLDHILCSVWLVMSCVIIAALLSVRFSTLIASLGTILLGLSWLVSSTAQESLASLVWVFCKHPIDVGDIIVVPGLLSSNSGSLTNDAMATLQGYTDGDTFEVEEIQLLSTVLRTTTTNKHVQVGNYILAQKPLVNLRRSGPIEEPFVLSVAYGTDLDKIEDVRQDMTAWIATQGRDYRPGLDIAVEGLNDQTQLKLSLFIRYRSNWQDSSLRIRRRNRWIAALKQVLAKHAVYGPHADASSTPATPAPPANPQGDVGIYEFMDSKPDKAKAAAKENRDDPELFGNKPESRSRLNEAMTSTAQRFTQHGHSTTHVDGHQAAGHHWPHTKDVEMGHIQH